MPINIQDILNQLKQGISTLAQTSLKDYVSHAQSDGQAILTSMEDDLKDWTTQLANGQLSADDFKDLVLGQSDNLAMAALKEAGLAAIQADQFKQAVLNLITSTIIGLIKV